MLSTVLGRFLTFCLVLSFVIFATTAAFNVPVILKAQRLKVAEESQSAELRKAIIDAALAELERREGSGGVEAVNELQAAAALKREDLEATQREARRFNAVDAPSFIVLSGIPLLFFMALAWILHPAVKRQAARVRSAA